MMNLSSASKARAVSPILGGLAIAAAFLAPRWGEGFVWGAVVPATAVAVALQLYWLTRDSRAWKTLFETFAELSGGNTERRIGGIRGRTVEAATFRAVNHFIDLTEAFCREAEATMGLTAQGRYFRRILTAGMPGAFSRHAHAFNQAQILMARRNQEFAATASNIGETIKHSSQGVAETARQLEDSARRMAALSEETGGSSSKAAGVARHAAENVGQAAALIDQIAQGVRDVAQKMENSTHIAGEAAAVAKETDHAVQNLAAAAERIGKVVVLIETVAEKTNLLALNATVEAARAGAAGKGFAVVASEVKNLAGQTGRATKDIAAQVEDVRKVTEDVVTAVRKIIAMVASIGDDAGEVFRTTEVQNRAADEINRRVLSVADEVRALSEDVAAVSGSAALSTDSAGGVLNAAAELVGQTQAVNTAIDSFVTRVSAGAHRA